MKKHESSTTHQHTESGIMDAMHKMTDKMNSMEMSGDIDHDFAEMMIMHHQAAIDMAEQQLDSGNDTSLKSFSRKIIEAQTKEIEELQQWLKKHETKK